MALDRDRRFRSPRLGHGPDRPGGRCSGVAWPGRKRLAWVAGVSEVGGGLQQSAAPQAPGWNLAITPYTSRAGRGGCPRRGLDLQGRSFCTTMPGPGSGAGGCPIANAEGPRAGGRLLGSCRTGSCAQVIDQIEERQPEGRAAQNALQGEAARVVPKARQPAEALFSLAQPLA
jgi:hypothetical protein